METSRALKLVPLPDLSIHSQKLSDIRAWKHGIEFHLSYYNLDYYLEENENEDEGVGFMTKRLWPIIDHEDRRRRLLAYSIIWSSAKDVIPFVERSLNKRLCDDVKLDPKKLWQLILEYYKIRFPLEDI